MTDRRNLQDDPADLGPKKVELYSCMNCRRFSPEVDVCTDGRYVDKFCFGEDTLKREEKCPGYNPPPEGNFRLEIRGPFPIRED